MTVNLSQFYMGIMYGRIIPGAGPCGGHPVAVPWGGWFLYCTAVHVFQVRRTLWNCDRLRPNGTAPVLIGPDRIPWLCTSDLTDVNVKAAEEKVAKTVWTMVSHSCVHVVPTKRYSCKTKFHLSVGIWPTLDCMSIFGTIWNDILDHWFENSYYSFSNTCNTIFNFKNLLQILLDIITTQYNQE